MYCVWSVLVLVIYLHRLQILRKEFYESFVVKAASHYVPYMPPGKQMVNAIADCSRSVLLLKTHQDSLN